MAILLDINTGTEKPVNPFKALREKQKAAQADITQQSSSVDIKEEQDVTSLITLGDEIVQNLLKEQSDPLSLQEKLKALFSADIRTDDPFPINARELHEFLGVGRDFSTWIKDSVSKYSFEENHDFQKRSPILGSGLNGGQNKIDYHFTLDAAKELAMVQKSALGKLVRRYLIWAEKKLHEATAVISQQQVQVPTTPIQAIAQIGKALSLFAQHTEIQDQKISDIVVVQTKQQDQLDKVQQDLDTLKQRVERSSNVSSILTEENNYDPISAEGNITVEEMADILHNRFGYDTGRNRLYDWLADSKMVIRYKKKGYKAAKQFEDLGWFETETESVNTPFSSVPVTRYKVWITQKGKQGITGRFGLSQ